MATCSGCDSHRTVGSKDAQLSSYPWGLCGWVSKGPACLSLLQPLNGPLLVWKTQDASLQVWKGAQETEVKALLGTQNQPGVSGAAGPPMSWLMVMFVLMASGCITTFEWGCLSWGAQASVSQGLLDICLHQMFSLVLEEGQDHIRVQCVRPRLIRSELRSLCYRLGSNSPLNVLQYS